MAAIRSIAGMPQVGLLLETSTEYGRGLLRGIVHYSRLHGPWSLYVAPGHLEQSMPKSKSWKGTGIVARVRSPEMAKVIRRTGLPFVASSLDESRPRGRLENAGYKAAELLDRLMSGEEAGEPVAWVEPVIVVTRLSSDVIRQGDPAVATALRFINNYSGKPIGVSDVVGHAHVSRRTLERRFSHLLSAGRSVRRSRSAGWSAPNGCFLKPTCRRMRWRREPALDRLRPLAVCLAARRVFLPSSFG